jgi:hypothetical protein
LRVASTTCIHQPERDEAIGVAVAAPGDTARGAAHAVEARRVFGREDFEGGAGQFGLGEAGAGPAAGRAAEGAGEARRLAGHAQPALAGGGLVKEAQHRHAPVQQADQRAEDGPAGEEGTSAIDRIEHPEPFGLAALGAVFLSHDAVVGEALAEETAQGALGGAVGLGDGRGITLCLHQQARAEQRADLGGGQRGGFLRRSDERRRDHHYFGGGALGEMERR